MNAAQQIILLGRPQAGGPSVPGLITATDTAFFEQSGCTWPWYGAATTPPADYDAATDTYWFVWQAWDGAGRRVLCKTYKPGRSPAWSNTYLVGLDPLVDDDHGVPARARDGNATTRVFDGAHGASAMLTSYTTVADDPSSFVAGTPIAATGGTGYTYPHPVAVGADFYLFMRLTVGTFQEPLCYRKATAIGAGDATWGAETIIIDYGANSRVDYGNMIKVGTDIYFTTVSVDGSDTYRRNVYLYVLDTTTGNIRNFDNSVTITPASFPISLATSNSSFRVVDQSVSLNMTCTASLALDTNGKFHIGYLDGPVGGPYNYMHTWSSNGSTWSVADTVGAFPSNDPLHRFDNGALITLPNGQIDAYWSTAATAANFTRGGDISKRTWASGAFGAQSLVLAARAAYALGEAAIVRNAPTDTSAIRVVFTEIAGQSVTESGFLRGFAYGDITNGFYRLPFLPATLAAVAAFATPPTDQRKIALNELIDLMSGQGAWQKFDWYKMYAAADKQAAFTNLANPGLYRDTEVGAITFVADSYVAGDGTTTKLNQGYDASLNAVNASQNSAACCVQVVNNVANDAYYDLGAAGPPFGQVNTRLSTSNNIRGTIDDAASSNYALGTISSAGWTCMSRTASNLITVFKDAVSRGTIATASTGLAAGTMFVCGTTAGFSARQIRSAGFGGGLTALQHQTQRLAEIRYFFAK